MHGSPRAGHPLDQSTLDQPARECTQRLIRLERELREVVQRSARVLIEMTQGIPLNERDVNGGQFRIERAVVPHLEALDREAHLLEWSRHDVDLTGMIAYLYKLAFLSVFV